MPFWQSLENNIQLQDEELIRTEGVIYVLSISQHLGTVRRKKQADQKIQNGKNPPSWHQVLIIKPGFSPPFATITNTIQLGDI